MIDSKITTKVGEIAVIKNPRPDSLILNGHTIFKEEESYISIQGLYTFTAHQTLLISTNSGGSLSVPSYSYIFIILRPNIDPVIIKNEEMNTANEVNVTQEGEVLIVNLGLSEGLKKIAKLEGNNLIILKENEVGSKFNESDSTKAPSGASTKNVEGGALYSEIISKQETGKNGLKILQEVFREFPKILLLAQITNPKPRLIEQGSDSVKVAWDIQISIDKDKYYKIFMPKLKQAFDNISLRKSDMPFTTTAEHLTGGQRVFGELSYSLESKPKPKFDREREIVFFLNEKTNDSGDRQIWSWYVLDKNMFQTIFDNIIKETPTLYIESLDNNNNVIQTDQIQFKINGSVDITSLSNFEVNDFISYPWILFPDSFSNAFIIKPFIGDFTTYRNKEVHIIYNATYSTNDLKLVSQIKCYFR